MKEKNCFVQTQFINYFYQELVRQLRTYLDWEIKLSEYNLSDIQLEKNRISLQPNYLGPIESFSETDLHRQLDFGKITKEKIKNKKLYNLKIKNNPKKEDLEEGKEEELEEGFWHNILNYLENKR